MRICLAPTHVTDQGLPIQQTSARSLYATPLKGYDIYLRMPWIRKRKVSIKPRGDRIRIRAIPGECQGVVVRSAKAFVVETAYIPRLRMVSAAV